MTSVAVEPSLFRAVLGQFCTGVTVVTSQGDGTAPAGFACQSFAALSLEPPLVLFCPGKSSRTWPMIEATGTFAVNVLAESQREISAVFGAPGVDKFAGLDWSPSPSGAPLLSGALTWIDCALETVHDAGDHYVVIGRVTALGEVRDGAPLLYHRGRYLVTEPVPDYLSWPGPDGWL
ncbi:3-hydroxy-9,10-secoandrosta-1,3,5(10)-triene-9,17-dione monooxygenase reductase subunit [Amycolatopsis sp.]|jgi:3-hydroxy-9,10-secoandrosta-1,3,5(10)-triene-9,17-dione monooxygenase reductase component|uniref:3-hydroxy-9,10-secoandrosta-1,3,5(10)-triene-9, 17-dione monooxygenase reductase subunit n=1 Tax=Amycolatopsis sp. TaxID=37632 RepID=UPI002E0CEDEB|nr:3-hydroxy-9,10-secoandrosta-1,3,5(10)-triene-9,17-dione monooxygenase reductase subunit [Amycolatopsis sp.]HEV7977820.1 flavin reductase family protein [Amycolatopsis sp.]